MGEFYKTERDIALYRTCWNIYPKILKKIKIDENEKILDAGCGKGELGKYIKIKNLYGFDFDLRAIEEAKKQNYRKAIKGDIYQIPFENKEFDKSICIEVLEYLEKPEEVFKELIRVTKKEIILSCANFNWYRIKSLLSQGWKEQYENQIKINPNFINSQFFKKLAKRYGIRIKIKYVSNKWGFFRDLLGNLFASEVVGIFQLHKI